MRVLEARARAWRLKYKILGRKIYFYLAPGKEKYIRRVAEIINRDNGAMIFESEIDYTRPKRDVSRQVERLYARIMARPE